MHPAVAPGKANVVRRRGTSTFWRALYIFALVGAAAGIVRGAAGENEELPGLNSLPEVEFKALGQRDWNPLGSRALAIHPAAWKHGETEHFIYHFRHSYVATPISVEAQFNYRVIAKALGLPATPNVSSKSHITFSSNPKTGIHSSLGAPSSSAIQAFAFPTIR